MVGWVVGSLPSARRSAKVSKKELRALRRDFFRSRRQQQRSAPPAEAAGDALLEEAARKLKRHAARLRGESDGAQKGRKRALKGRAAAKKKARRLRVSHPGEWNRELLQLLRGDKPTHSRTKHTNT